MAPIALDRLRVFAALYEAGSFTKAAERLGVPRSTVSRALEALEDSLGESLVVRTTRSVTFTDEGRDLYDRTAPSIRSLEGALRERGRPEDEPSGPLRITSTPDLGVAVLADVTARFRMRYPKTSVDLVLTATPIDLVREGIDLALRITSKSLPDSRLLARRVGTFELRLFASPGYVARRGSPRVVADLASHDLLGFGKVVPTAIPGLGAKAPRSPITCDEMFVLRELVRRGAGIGAMPTFVAAEDLRDGALVPVLPRLSLHRASVTLLQRAQKHPPSRITAFRDLLVETLRQRPISPGPAGG